MGWALVQQGQLREGIAQMRQSLDAYRATGAEVLGPHFLALLAHGYAKAEQVEEGLNAITVALQLLSNNGESYYQAELCRLKGELLLKQEGSNFGESENCFKKACRIARRQKAKSLELRAATSLARLWSKQGRRREAHNRLARVYGWFTEGFDTADLRDAKTLLDELA